MNYDGRIWMKNQTKTLPGAGLSKERQEIQGLR